MAATSASEFYLAVGGDPAHPDSVNLQDHETTLIRGGSLNLDQPGQIFYTQTIKGPTSNERNRRAAELLAFLASAAERTTLADGLTFSMRRFGAEDWTHYDLHGYGGDAERAARVLNHGRMAEYDLQLGVHPYARSDVLSIETAGTFTGSTAAILLRNIPGSRPALARFEFTDTSPTGAINLVRLAVIPGPFEASTDYTAWIDGAAISPASAPASAAALGGFYAERTTTSMTHVPLARMVQPAGTRQRGRFSGFLRANGTGTVIGTPASLTGTAARSAAAVRQSTADITGVISPAWSSTTLAGSTLVGIVTGANTGGTAVTEGTTPSGYSLQALGGSNTSRNGTTPTADYVFAAAYANQNASAVAAGTGVTMDTTGETFGANVGFIVELTNIAAMIGEMGTQEGLVPSTIPILDVPANTIMIAYAYSASAQPVIGGGFTNLYASNGLTVAYRRVTNATSFRPTASVSGTGAVLFNVLLFAEAEIPAEYQLAAGSYGARVQAIDAAGYRGNALAASTVTATIGQNSIGWTWGAVSGAVAYVITFSYLDRFYEAIVSGTSYSLTTLAGLKEVTAMPATAGAVAPAPRMRLTVGTENDHVFTPLPEFAMDGDSTFRLYRAFADVPLPPVATPLGGGQPEWSAQVEVRSANGLNATGRADALWLPPAREPYAEAWIHGLAESTKRHFVLETHRSGKGINAWLEDTAMVAEAGRLNTAGSLLIPPGDSILLMAFEQAAGAHVFTARGTVSLKVWPRNRWEHGA
jgi:hypothetical protein